MPAYGVSIRDAATLWIDGVVGRIRAEFRDAVGSAGVLILMNHFTEKESASRTSTVFPSGRPKLGHSGLYAAFARQTQYAVSGSGAILSVNHPAARQRFQGGDIRPSSGTYKVRGDKDFFEKHKDILSEPFAHLGASQEVIDQSTIYKTHREKLVNLNLINKRFPNIKKGEIPEFDNKTGMMKANGYELTSLGRLFLKYIDLQDEI
jgi:hypothetical protein